MEFAEYIAAAKIQAAARGAAVRRELADQRERERADQERARAATQIQSTHRGKHQAQQPTPFPDY